MALRLIEMVCNEERRAEIEEVVREFEPLEVWHDRLMDDQIMVQILLHAEKAEAVLDTLESRFSWTEGFRVLLLNVEAVLPHPKPPEKQPAHEQPLALPNRISRHEMYAEIHSSAKLDRTYVAMVVLSAVVAAIGLLDDNVAVVVGAMVIAPLLGPCMALAFASTLGDVALARRALRTTLVGVPTALLLTALLGVALDVTPALDGELMGRATVGLGDIVLALAAGTAGALAFTTGISTPLVGVMVAVALMPPLVAAGLFLGMGYWSHAVGAALLFTTNLICINLAGVATFLIQGIRPRTWWQADRARRAARRALTVWIILLLALVAIIVTLPR